MNFFISFPPLFPHSKYLSKKWWHRLIWGLSSLYCLSAIYAFFIFLFFFLVMVLKIGPMPFPEYLFLPAIPVLYPLVSFQTSTVGEVGFGSFADPNLGYIILLTYFLVSIFLPSLIYLIMLNGILGKRWKN